MAAASHNSGMKCADRANNPSGVYATGRAGPSRNPRPGKFMRGLHRILIVDDDAALRQSLAEQLELHAEFASLQCDSAAAALRILQREPCDAVLLDVGLPDMDGRELCRRLRGNGITAPIVMLAASDSEADTVLGLDAGA